MFKKKIAPSEDFVADGKTKEVKKEAKKKEKKPGFLKRLGRKIKDIFSELKKVSWPGFAKVVKQTGVVLVVVLVFLVVIFGFDFGLAKLVQLISPQTLG